jgi:hypothetical protein
MDGDSWFRADPEAVKRYSAELADKNRPETERIEALKHLKILLKIYGPYNFEPALPVLKAVRREPTLLGHLAAFSFEDLQIALKNARVRVRR